MKCPKCRCEVGNQPVCPYCGATVYVNSTWGINDHSRRSTVPVTSMNSKILPDHSELMKRLHSLETKVSLLLVLEGGSFVLMLLILIVLVLG